MDVEFDDFNESNFRWERIDVYLTYSQTKQKMTPQWLLEEINQKAEIDKYLISQERHHDGGYHLHAWFKFLSKISTKNPRFFDVIYYKNPYHPTIRKPSKARAKQFTLFKYIKKEGQYITNMDETRPKWKVLLDEIVDEDQFLEELLWMISDPRNYGFQTTLKQLWKMRNTVSNTDRRTSERLAENQQETAYKSILKLQLEGKAHYCLIKDCKNLIVDNNEKFCSNEHRILFHTYAYRVKTIPNFKEALEKQRKKNTGFNKK